MTTEPITEHRELAATRTSTCCRRVELVELINDEDARVAPAVGAAAAPLAAAIDAVVERLRAAAG